MRWKQQVNDTGLVHRFKQKQNIWNIFFWWNVYFFSVYDDPCEYFANYYANHSCPQAIIDLGLTCGCPIYPVHLVRSPLSTLGSSSTDFWFTDPITDILSGKIEVKKIPAAWGFLLNVSIHNLPFTSFCQLQLSQVYLAK